MTNSEIIKQGQAVLSTEITAMKKTCDAIGDDFAEIVQLILHCQGKVVITGIGKPGHVGVKMAATLASLGTPSFFMHPAEAMHGDLGMVEQKDVVMMLSYSGESVEVTSLLPVLKEIGCTTIAVTGNPKSTLARDCQHHFFFPPFEEACYLHLAPTSSTTALMALGDAVAVVCSRLRNYTREEFGLHHPAGSLGKKLLVKVSDIMHGDGTNAVVKEKSTLKQAIVEMSAKGLSMVSVVSDDGCLQGIITDGDLRRMLERGVNVYNELVGNVMTRTPKHVDDKEMAVNALQRMNDLHITGMPVTDSQGKVVGAILMQDILKAGIVQ